jgi:hypothetical protein
VTDHSTKEPVYQDDDYYVEKIDTHADTQEDQYRHAPKYQGMSQSKGGNYPERKY